MVSQLAEVHAITMDSALALQAKADAFRDMLDYFGADALIIT